MTTKCVACGHTDLIENVSVIDRGESCVEWKLTLKTYKNPDALFFKGTKSAEVEAKVCPACGYVMLFTSPFGVAVLRGNA